MRRPTLLVISVLICAMLSVGNTYSIEAITDLKSTRGSEAIGMSGRVSLDLRNMDVIEALKFLAMKAGVNIVTTKMVTGRVTLRVENVGVQDIFDVMLRSNGLAYDSRNNIYSVMTEVEYKALYGKTFSDVREVKVFYLDYAIPEQIFSLCDTLKSDIGRVLVNPESGSVVIMDSPSKIKVIEKAVREFEKKTDIRIFDINYANAVDVAEQLKAQIEGKKLGFVRADIRSNQVIVQTLPDRMEVVQEMIKQLDRKTKEVLIEAKVIKVNLRDELNEAIEWEGLFEAIRNEQGLTYIGTTPFASVQGASDPWRSRKTVLDGGITPDGTPISGVDGVGAFPFSGTTPNLRESAPRVGAGEMHIGMVGVHDIDFILRSLRNIGETEIMGTPKITVANNIEAKLHVGERQAYVTSTTTTGQTTSTVAEDINFIDVGLQFFVTPTINEEGYITLKVKTEVSNVVDTLVTPTGNRIPILDTNTAETVVMSKSGTTVVIGGLRQNTRVITDSKTPFLGDIPYFGKFFKRENEVNVRVELLILITSTIVEGDILVGKAHRPAGKQLIKPAKQYKIKKDPKTTAEYYNTTLGEIRGFKVDK
jgi:type II secretory pathway component GspD/PulD (secretin)